MGYNSNLTKEQNETVNQPEIKRHKLFRIGKVLRVAGISFLILGMMTGVFSGSALFFVLGFFNPVTWAGALLLAFGQYFVSNWKYK